VGLLNGDTQQKDTDAAFEEHVRDNVSWFAGPPPLIEEVSIVRYSLDVGTTHLHAQGILFVRNEISSFSSSILQTQQR
jgi:hypothetical protein